MSTMNLHVLFIQRSEAYEGQCAPEAILAWDEFAVEEGGKEFALACERALVDAGDDVVASAVIEIAVDQDAIRKRLLSNLKIEGKIVG